MSEEIKFEDLEFHNFYEYLPVPASLRGNSLNSMKNIFLVNL